MYLDQQVCVLSDVDPELCFTSQLEQHLETLSVRAQKELILLHKDELANTRPRNTVDWLNIREWCSAHHHIRCPKRVFSKRPASKQVCYVLIEYGKILLYISPFLPTVVYNMHM